MRVPIAALITTSCVLWIASTSCSSNISPTRFTNPQFDFGFIERVAVIPLENFSGDKLAGERVARLITTELLASDSVDVVEIGEVLAAKDRLRGVVRNSLSSEQLIALGEALEVQGLIFGTVAESEIIRSGTTSIPVVTLDLHMVETETAAPVWAATHSEIGSDISAKLLGTGATPLSVTTRKCVREILKSLLG